MEEDIKILEERLNEHHTNIFGNKFLVIYEKDIQAIENLLTRYKQLEEEKERIIREKAEALQEVRKYKAKVKDYIPTSLVEDKIKELKSYEEELTDEQGYWGGSDLLEQIKVLQELLEKEK